MTLKQKIHWHESRAFRNVGNANSSLVSEFHLQGVTRYHLTKDLPDDLLITLIVCKRQHQDVALLIHYAALPNVGVQHLEHHLHQSPTS